MIDRKNRHVPSPRKGRDKPNPFKMDAKVKCLIKELDLAGRRYKRKHQGHRDQVYASMQTAQRVIAECLKNGDTYTRFLYAVRHKEKNARNRSFILSLEAMSRAMGAISTPARKLASKRAKVLDYLRKIGVKVEDTAAAVKKEGLEALYAKVRKDSGEPKKKGEAKSRQHDSKIKQTSSSLIGRGAPRAGRNDTERLLALWMKQSDRDQLLDSKLNTRFTVMMLRVSEDDGDIRIQRIVPGDHLNDWED